ncbi:MAG: hypothetical protein QOE28_29 [Solirubrobacteraceae bacterium]|nr:hypothetical protein [Solirubrobacteraceae bacterium]
MSETTTPPPDAMRKRHPAHSAFGNDRFGVLAERFARFFGTPRFIIGQSIIVAIWIAINAVGLSLGWDPYPFILLNLAFSTQAAYAAPLILLAQTRQADRDKISEAAFEKHRDDIADRQLAYESRIADLLENQRAMQERLAHIVEQNDALAGKLREPS